MSKDGAAEITRACRASFADAEDPRRAEIADALVRHLHAFVTEVRPTREEWAQAIGFLTKVGKACEGSRQEFILLSDVLGVSMLVETINQSANRGATESTVLGPFYVDSPPLAEQGADIAETCGKRGDPLWIDIAVTDTLGNPVPGATVDIWQCAADGLYDVQRDLAVGAHELRARFTTDEEGRVCCWSTVPVPYQIPSDGPVGELLQATGRHPWRPAHVHFRIEQEGYAPLVTHLFPAGDPYLDSDTVFGVKPSLIVDLPQGETEEAPAERTCGREWRSLSYQFQLESTA